MDFNISNGDYNLTPSGHIERVSGDEDIKQRILIRLVIRKGSFVYDEDLGSELYKLYREKRSNIPNMAKQYVIDALEPETDISVQDVSVIWMSSNEIQISIEVLDFEGNTIEVEVKV